MSYSSSRRGPCLAVGVGFSRASTAAVVLIALSFAGCGGKKDEGSGRPVTGKVTYNGQAVADATVTFVGPANSAFGRTDAEGNFKLRTTLGENVPLGDYQVSITKTDSPPVPPGPTNPEEYQPPDPNAPPAPEPKDLLPAKYKTASTSQLTASVKDSGENNFEFSLTD